MSSEGAKSRKICKKKTRLLGTSQPVLQILIIIPVEASGSTILSDSKGFLQAHSLPLRRRNPLTQQMPPSQKNTQEKPKLSHKQLHHRPINHRPQHLRPLSSLSFSLKTYILNLLASIQQSLPTFKHDHLYG